MNQDSGPSVLCCESLKSADRSELQHAVVPLIVITLQSLHPCFDKLHHVRKPAENSQVKMFMI